MVAWGNLVQDVRDEFEFTLTVISHDFLNNFSPSHWDNISEQEIGVLDKVVFLNKPLIGIFPRKPIINVLLGRMVAILKIH